MVVFFHAVLVASGMGVAGTPDAEYVSEREALVRDASESTLKAWEAGSDWRKRVTALDVRAWQYDQSVAAAAWTIEPTATRVPAKRFMDPRLETPSAAGPLLARLTWGGEPVDVRVALVEALVRTGGDWSPVVLSMLPEETDVSTRSMMVQVARRAPPANAVSIVRLGFADKAAPVRAAAAETCPWVEGHEVLDAMVVTALADTDPGVRAEAARSAGWMEIDGSWAPIVKLLADADAGVRLQALRALQRLDPADTAELPEVEVLKHDKDLKVQRAATEAAPE